MTRVAAYHRVSTVDQERGASLDGQRRACRDYADARGWEIVAEYQDVLSGRDPERPGYRALLAANATYDLILVWKFDRLGRDEADAFVTYKELLRVGRDVHSCTEPNDSVLVRGILTVIAAEESRRIGQRVRLGMRERVQAGHWQAAAPWGYRLVRTLDTPPELEIDPEAAALIEEAAQRIEAGETLYGIAADWTRRGLPTPRQAAAWSAWMVAAALRNPLTAGLIRWPGIAGLVPGRHAPILERARWERLDALIRGGHRRPVSRADPADGKLLVGLFRCDCGAPMIYKATTVGGVRYRYYTCDRQRRGHDGCTLPSVRAADAEAAVEAALTPLLAADASALLLRAERAAAATQSADAVAADRERERLARVVEAETRKLTRQREMLQADLMTEAEYRADRARTLAALQAAEGALTALGAPTSPQRPTAGTAAHLATVGQLWPLATADERRALLADLGCRATRRADGIALEWPAEVGYFLSQ